MNADLYKAAAKGTFEMLENYAQTLDHLLGHNKSTILHVHLNSPCERSTKFVEKVLGQCPQLLWQTDSAGATPLHIAAKYGHLNIVKVFIEEAKKPIHRDLETGGEEEDSIRRMVRLTNEQKETALHLAIRDGCLEVVQEILKPEDPNFTYTANESGETPLYLAIYQNETNIAAAILNKFASPDCSGPNGRTAFHVAACRYSTADSGLLDLLLSKLGSFVNQADESGWTPLHYAAYLDNAETVSQILGKDIHSAYATEKERNRTALHIASCRGNLSVMEKIIDKCPECCEIRDARGWNVLHYAVISKSEESVKAILKDPSLIYLIIGQDIKGYTPLQLLQASDHSSSLLSWLHDKSDIPYKSKFNRTTFLDGDKDRQKEKIQGWMKELGTDPLGETFELKKVTRERKKSQTEREGRVLPVMEKAKDSHLIAAALVATVTFAAAFTLPGGYISDESNSNLKGTPILSRNGAFKAFVVTDAMALVLSTSCVFIHFIMVMLGYKRRYYWLIRSAFWFLALAMGAMVVAFVTGTYAVLAPSSKGLAIATFLIGLTFFLHVAYAIIRLVFKFITRDRTDSLGQNSIEALALLVPYAP